MKFVILLLLAILPFTLAVDGTCASHPKIDDIAALIDGLEDELEEAEFTAIQTAFQTYREGNGDAAWTTALSGADLQCTGFGDGSDSCCTDDFVQHFKTIFKGTMKRKGKKEKPIQREFLKQFGKSLGKCEGKDAVKEFLELEAVSTFLDGLKTCRQNTAEVSMNFIRRNFCTICFSGAEMSSNFDADGKLIVTQASLNAYDDASLATFDCYDNLNGDLFDAIEDFYAEIYDDLDDSKACDRFADWIYALIENGPESIAPQKPTTCKSQAKFMGNGGGCEEKFDGEGIFEEGGSMGPPTKGGKGGIKGERPKGYKPDKSETEEEQDEQEGEQQQQEGEQQAGEQQAGEQQAQDGANRRLLETLRVLTEDDTDFSVGQNGYELYKDETTAMGDSTVISEAYGEESIDIDVNAITIEEDEEQDDDDSSNRLNLIFAVLCVILGALL